MMGKFPDLANRQAFAAENDELYSLFTDHLEGRAGGSKLDIGWQLRTLQRKSFFMTREEREVALAGVFRVLANGEPGGAGRALVDRARKSAAAAGLKDASARNGIFDLLEEAFVDWLGQRKAYPQDPVPSLELTGFAGVPGPSTVGAALCCLYGKLPETLDQVVGVRGLVREMLVLAFPVDSCEQRHRNEVAQRFPDLPAIAEEILTTPSILEDRVPYTDGICPSSVSGHFRNLASLLALRGYDFGPLDSALGNIWTRRTDGGKTPMEAAFLGDVSFPLQKSLRNERSYLTLNSEDTPLVFSLVLRKQYDPAEIRPFWGVQNRGGIPLVQYIMEHDRSFIPDESGWDIVSSSGRSVREMLAADGRLHLDPESLADLSAHDWGVLRGMTFSICAKKGERIADLERALDTIEREVPDSGLKGPVAAFLSSLRCVVDRSFANHPGIVEAARALLRHPRLRETVVSVGNQSTNRSAAHQIFLMFAERHFSARDAFVPQNLELLATELIRVLKPAVLRQILEGKKGTLFLVHVLRLRESASASEVLNTALELNLSARAAESLQVTAGSPDGEPEPYL
jgi:hypothetical protein